MARPVSDEELQLKKRARRRLVGAIVLVTAVAVILPKGLGATAAAFGQDNIGPRVQLLADVSDPVAPEMVATGAISEATEGRLVEIEGIITQPVAITAGLCVRRNGIVASTPTWALCGLMP